MTPSGDVLENGPQAEDTAATRSVPPDLWLAVVLGAATVLLHILTATDSYGIFRDELYYLANAEHLAFGYVDHPPLIGLISWIARNLIGESMLALRLMPALAAGITVAVVCSMASELGGGSFSQLLAGLTTALTPVYVSLFGFLSMNAFDVMFWAILAHILIRLLRTGDLRWWLSFGVVAGLALENKISPLFLGFGVVVGLLVTRDWRHFKSRWLWIGGGVAGLLFLPYVVWQAVHGWPLLTFMENATQNKNLPLSPLGFLGEQVMQLNPLLAPIALAGFVFYFGFRSGRPYRSLGWAVLAVLVVMIATRAKAYYFAPSYPLLLAPGAIVVERLSSRRGLAWLRVMSVVLVVCAGAVAFPMAKPVLPVKHFVAYQERLGIAPQSGERHEMGRLPQFYADRLGWPELAQTVAGVYHDLPAPDRRTACIFAQNYGQAGAIDFYGREFGLPPAISAHNSYHIWGPRDCTGEVLIVIGSDRDDLEPLFDSVELAATFTCQDCMPYENNKGIWVCRGLREHLAELWPRIASFG